MTTAAFDGVAFEESSFELEDNDEMSITNFFRHINGIGSLRSR